jgi:uncharacterized protein YecT (DUF1311 family)
MVGDHMNLRGILNLGLCALLSANGGIAQGQDISRQSQRSADRIIPCLDMAWQYSREQIKCFYVDSEEQFRLATRAYESALKRATPAQRRKLAASQKAWIKAKERRCHTYRLYAPEVAGTDETAEIYACLGDEGVNRIDWLERQYRKQRSHH